MTRAPNEKSESGAPVVLFVQFAVLSLFAIGAPAPWCRRCSARWSRSGLALRPPAQRIVRDRTQAAPGLNLMFVALLGHFIAGAPAAIVATACVCEPTCFLAFGVSWAL